MEDAPARMVETDGGAIASLVLGILGITVIPIVLSVLALFFGYRARARLRGQTEVSGGGLATAGIVLGWIGVALMAVWAIVLASFLD